MKSLILLSVTLLSFTFSYSQSLHNAKWKDGKEMEINGHNIIKISTNDKRMYGEYTNISYESIEFSIDKAKKRASNEMWTSDKLDEELRFVNRYPGGIINLFIGRPTIGSANTEYFTMIVLKNGIEIHREKFKEDIPQVPITNDVWWNSAAAYIKNELTPPFDVIVIDELDRDNPKKIFKVLN